MSQFVTSDIQHFMEFGSWRRAAWALPLLAVSFTGCATTHFIDKPPLWREPETPIPVPPPQNDGIQWTGLRDAILAPLDRAFTLDYGKEAQNVNSWDEVPDSSWWVDNRRDGLEHNPPRVLGPDAIARGGFGDDPGPVPPFRVVKGKTIGSTPGIVILDAKNVRYLFKLDPAKHLGLNSSTEVVSTRIVWAAGWLVPSEKLIDVKDEQITLDPKAKTDDAWGDSIPLSQKKLDELLKRTPREADGTIRVCASKWLEGKALGSWAYRGRRRSDANDRVLHENRRDVRGFGVIAAWLNDIDTMENNTLDTYVGKPGQGHLVHWQQDVGGSFGQFAAIPNEVWMGEETFFMPGRILLATISVGLLSRTWEGSLREERRRALLEDFPELGYFDDASFNPRNWHPVLDNTAFVRQTRRDRYWGAKRIAAFTPDEVRTAVALGNYPPETEQRLFNILWNRRDKILRAFFSDVAALDYFSTKDGRLCFHDLWVESGLGGGDPGYTATIDGAPASISDRCVAISRGDYRVVELGVGSTDPRAERKRHVVDVHVVSDDRGLRVVGVDRL